MISVRGSRRRFLRVQGFGERVTQGFLQESDSPVNGSFDLEFRLYDAASGGSQVGDPVTVENKAVSDGLFVVELDFGSDPFAGDGRWLAISVRPDADSGDFTALDPRQPLTPAPYALFARRAPWSGLAGVPAGFADGIDDNTTYSAGTGLSLAGGEMSVASSYRLAQGCADGRVSVWDETAGGWTCAENLTRLADAANGVLSNDFDASWELASTVVIPDTGTNIASLVVSDSGTLLDVSVAITIAHPNSETLRLQLKFVPEGASNPTHELTLFQGSEYPSGICPALPAPADCLDPDSDPYCEESAWNFPTADQPVSGSLDDFAGVDPSGSWQLWVEDSCESYPGSNLEGTQFVADYVVDYTIFSDQKARVTGTLTVSDGYLQLATVSGGTPPAGDCDAADEAGRMIVRSDGPPNLYICDGSNWVGIQP